MRNRSAPATTGIIAAVALFAAYIIIVRLFSGSWRMTQLQLGETGGYVIALAAGFGVQVGLWRAIRRAVCRHAGAVTATVGTTSTTAMILCCTHYLVNVLPWLGVTGIAAAAGTYQREIFIVGIASNLFGVAYMLRVRAAQRSSQSGVLPTVVPVERRSGSA